MSSATLSNKGQVTIPRTVRKALALEPGDVLDFVDTDLGILLIPAKKRDLTALRGILKGRRKTPATIEEMNEAIAEMGSRG